MKHLRLFGALTLASSFLFVEVASAQELRPSSPTLSEFMATELRSSSRLTADEVARRALQSSRELDAASARADGAKARQNAAELSYLPTLTTTARYTRISKRDNESAGSIVVAPGAANGPLPPGAPLASVPLAFESPVNQYSLEATLLVPVSDYLSRLPAQRGAARADHRAQLQDLEAERLRVRAAAKNAYYRWVHAKLSAVVAERALSLAQTHLADAEHALAVGSATSADVSRVRSEVARSELGVQNARSSITLAERELRLRMHDRGTTGYAIGEDLLKPVPTPQSDTPAFVQRAITQRPELVALEQRIEATNKSATAERSASLPRLELLGSVAYQNPDPRSFPQRDEFKSSWQAGAQVVWNLTNTVTTHARAKSTDAAATELAANRKLVEERIELEVVNAVEALRQSQAALTASASSMAAAEDSYRARRILFQNGRATSSELLDAETELIRAELASVDAQINLRIALVGLEAATAGGASAQK